MLKRSALLLLLSVFGLTAIAQQHSNIVQAGLGVNHQQGNTDEFSWMPAIHFTYERMLPLQAGPGNFGVGLTAAYQHVKEPMPGWAYDRRITTYIRSNTAIAALRVAYHLRDVFKTDKLDLYGALQAGPRFYSKKYDGSTDYGDLGYNSDETRLHIGLIAGARFYFAKYFGAFAEMGYDLSWAKAGMAVRF